MQHQAVPSSTNAAPSSTKEYQCSTKLYPCSPFCDTRFIAVPVESLREAVSGAVSDAESIAECAVL